MVVAQGCVPKRDGVGRAKSESDAEGGVHPTRTRHRARRFASELWKAERPSQLRWNRPTRAVARRCTRAQPLVTVRGSEALRARRREPIRRSGPANATHDEPHKHDEQAQRHRHRLRLPAASRLSGDIRELSQWRVSSAPAGVGNNAADEQRDPGNQPWQRVQVLIASACPCGLPAGRAWPGTLKPSDVEEKNADTAEESERGTADRGPRSHQPAGHSDRCENEYAERHEAERSSTSDKRPRPEPAAVGDMSTER